MVRDPNLEKFKAGIKHTFACRHYHRTSERGVRAILITEHGDLEINLPRRFIEIYPGEIVIPQWLAEKTGLVNPATRAPNPEPWSNRIG